MESKKKAVEENNKNHEEKVKIVKWEDFQHELARLSSLSSALNEANHNKSLIQEKLNSHLQSEAESLSRSNQLDELREKLEARKLVMGNMSMHSKVIQEKAKKQEEQLNSEIRSLLMAGSSLSVATRNLQEANNSLAGERGYVHLKKVQKSLRARQQFMVSQISLLYPVKVVTGHTFEQELDSFSSSSKSGDGGIPTTLDGPFTPVTVPLDQSFRGHAVDLPADDPRVQRTVKWFEPEQISISLSTDYDSVWISWITGEFQIGYNIKPLNPDSVASVVEYGKTKSLKKQTQKTEGYSLIYNQLYPFKGLQNYTSGIIHHVQLTGLSPDTVYFYRCGDPSIGAMSDVFRFKTMPVSSSKNYPKIGIVGDLGLTYNTTSTVSHLIKNNPDLMLLVGDATYANLYLTDGTGSDCYSCSFANTPIHETYQPRWDYWGRYMQQITSKVPIMAIEGNHEIEEQVDSTTFASYNARFAFPSKESGSKSAMYYSFNAGGIHFLMLGGYIAYNKSSDQYKWLQRDLAQVDREVTPWLVGVWHPPWYSTYVSHYKEAECMRVAMEELLYDAGVDIIFNGHVHAYERSNRVYNYTLDPCGPVHITVGDGGNREKMAVKHADEPGNCPEPSSTPDSFMGGFCAYNFTSGPAAGKFCWARQPEYSAYRESSFGHGILEVKNETHALWTWHRNQDMYNVPGDQIFVVREPKRCPVKAQVMLRDL